MENKEETTKKPEEVVVETKDAPISSEGESKKFRGMRGRRQRTQARSDLDRKVLSARRVSRVVAGGRRFSLSVAVAVGDRKGKVGVGLGKGPDMAIATEKGMAKAKKNMMTVPLTENKSIPYETTGKFCGSVVSLRPSEGFVAGGAIRMIAELAGIKNLNAKILSRSKSHLNNARATMKALASLK